MEDLSAQRVLEELEAIAFANATDLVAVSGGELVVRDTDSLPELARAVAAVERSSTGIRVKFYDKLRALELLGKALGLFEAGAVQQQETNLVEAILQATREEVCIHDLPELQQAAAAGHDLVEPAESEKL